ncbi:MULTISPECIES: hypothetical protein [Methanoculleus]|jgi:hypothetical protein|uniref:Uncharacterized protein n=1 Tax=Methanoculleus nereidis TaxID=2735141 RepID=A0ABU3YZA1_9EURY|nr:MULTISPECIES: hypothetical protein [Methanoculleus]MDD3071222.1 hypothetical protein [Methanoculleus horonobensis]MDD4253367.1 hypothetical protein [Methanoculleus horonobensis]MDV4341898.1 hypothetical protein [Methanoculleus sp. YWC-01]
MDEEKFNQLLGALSVPVIVLAFFPLWVIVSLIPIAIVPDPRALIGAVYATALTLSFVYFGLKMRSISSAKEGKSIR